MDDVTISFRPRDQQGGRILDELQRRIETRPELKSVQIVEDVVGEKTRRYRLVGEDVDIDNLDPELDGVALNWREHVEHWRES